MIPRTETGSSPGASPAADPAAPTAGALGANPLWYKDAVIYEARVGAFHDSDGDGVGDFRGMIEKLDYLRDLGVTAIWLLPFYPSPMRDDGYDISDYVTVHPQSGTLDDFRRFLDEAHGRDLRVITELVVNHTSDQHPWFQRARRAPPGSREREFYVWSETDHPYREARVIFQDFERSNWSWDPVAEAYYWHRFFSHQPDLNYDSGDVREAILEVLDFWLGMGVDGLRLDAVPYLFEREGTNCENLPETHAFLRQLRRHVDARHPGRMLLAEANQWPEDARAYFGDGDECHMCFHFPVMPRLFMAIRTEDRFPILDIHAQTPPIPESCQWALFLRNHDELTLEMVTDEERDYMYRVYANDPRARLNLGIRRRLAPLLANDRRKMELMNALLLSLPGTPVIYYGDEIGMGDNIFLGDRDGVRTPMQWSPERNAGFSKANPQRLYLPLIIDPEYHYEALNVEVQRDNPQSFLWWMRRIIALRKSSRALGRGNLEFLRPENPKILAYVRRYEGDVVLAVANLSRFAQHAELDLGGFEGCRPVELFGRSEFPLIEKRPWVVTLAGHGFYWFALQSPRAKEDAEGPLPASAAHVPLVRLRTLDELRDPRSRDRAALEAALGAVLLGPERAARLTTTTILDVAVVTHLAVIVLVRLEVAGAEPETRALPLSILTGERAREAAAQSPDLVLLRLPAGADGEPRLLVDALAEPRFREALLELVREEHALPTALGRLAGRRRGALGEGGLRDGEPLAPLTTGAHSASVTYARSLVLKLFRRVDAGPHPQVELQEALAGRAGTPVVPPVVGTIEWQAGREGALMLAVLERWVPHETDAHRQALDALGRYFERALSTAQPPPTQPLPGALLVPAVPDAEARERLGIYSHTVDLLGARIADLHVALAGLTDGASFAPERLSLLYRRSLYQAMRGHALRVLDTLATRLPALAGAERAAAMRLVAERDALLACLREVQDGRIDGLRIRIHGNLTLDRILFTGRDFVFIDFEGDPGRPLGERRLKRSPLRDVARLVRSFLRAAAAEAERTRVRLGMEASALDAACRHWQRRIPLLLVEAWLPRATAAGLVPGSRAELATLLRSFLLDEAMAEVADALGDGVVPLPRAVDLVLDFLQPLALAAGRAPDLERKESP